jgi:hypothetical protein
VLVTPVASNQRGKGLSKFSNYLNINKQTLLLTNALLQMPFYSGILQDMKGKVQTALSLLSKIVTALNLVN